MYRIPVLIALVAILATLSIGIVARSSSSAHAMLPTIHETAGNEQVHGRIFFPVCITAQVPAEVNRWGENYGPDAQAVYVTEMICDIMAAYTWEPVLNTATNVLGSPLR